MKIEIMKEEYRLLLDVLHMAQWVMGAHKTEGDARAEPYEKLIQKFYALAEAMGLERMIEYDPEQKEYFQTREFEDASGSWEFIDEFTDATFWDELIHRLTDRDVARKVGGYDQLDKLNMKERFTLEAPVLEKYAKEVDENGVDRLEVVEHFGQKAAGRPATHD